MNDFFEIDFLDVEAAKSGDAITIRYFKMELSRYMSLMEDLKILGSKLFNI